MPRNKNHYISPKNIGLFVLFNSIKEQWPHLGYSQEFVKMGLYCVTDWNYIFKVAYRTLRSFIKGNRWDIAIDITSFYLFLRIYYDTLASLVSYFCKLLYPSNSRRLPKSESFSDQLKWLDKNAGTEFTQYKKILKKYSFEKFFKQGKILRDKLKTPPHNTKSKRMIWLPPKNDLIKQIGLSLYKTIEFTDILGEYFLIKFAQIKSLKRMEKDHHGYSRSLMRDEETETYKWFILKFCQSS